MPGPGDFHGASPEMRVPLNSMLLRRLAVPHDGPERRCLARAVAAEETDELALLNLEGEAVEDTAALDLGLEVSD